MKIWIVFGSKFGQTEAVAHRVAKGLRAHGHLVTVSRRDHIASSLSVDDFDVVLVAGSVILGRYQRYIRDFVRRNLRALRARPTGFISVNGTSPETVPEWRTAAKGYVERFLKQTPWRPRWIAMFSGGLPYTRYGFVVRWVMKRISQKTGGPTDTSKDHDFTDWEAVDRFAEDVASAQVESALTEAGMSA
jgi:menaquinone-dependent protoporphyrinogen oxidase